MEGREAQIALQIAKELQVRPQQVEAAIGLIDEGNTIPFIARYRKEKTGALDDAQLRTLGERLEYLRGLEERRAKVLESIAQQEKLTPELEAKILAAATLVEIEDLYRPYRPRRVTRASIARERGLAPLADYLLAQSAGSDEEIRQTAAQYVSGEKGVKSAAEALQGAQDILAEQISDNADYRTKVRDLTWKKGVLETELKPAGRETGEKKSEKAADRAAEKLAAERRDVYDNYSHFSEELRRIPTHRLLAVNRGEKEKVLTVRIQAPEAEIQGWLLTQIVKDRKAPNRAVLPYLVAVVKDSYHRLIAPAIERELRSKMTEEAEDASIVVFRQNLEQLLMQQPVAGKTVLGWDPAFRTGCKLAVVDPTGKVLDTKVIYPTAPQNRVEEAERDLHRLVEKWKVDLFSVGNGTASRESEQVITDFIRKERRPLQYVIVNEAGASVYSASKAAAEEFPEFDVGPRSAVSIARRLQEPMAELVKIDPRSIGVGQYQHDMDQKKLSAALGGVVEKCVNSVGVDLNTASYALLSYIAGISQTVAKNIVAYREEQGVFRTRKELLKVKGLGPKAYEQCAGFLRIRDGAEPLDNTGVHPESYGAVRQLLQQLGLTESSADLSKVRGRVRDIPASAAQLGIGEITLRDILTELDRPGRDPRDSMPAPLLRRDVLSMEDLRPGMKLKGTVRNIVDFGAFVDIGVHQDGLVHISKICDRFIRHPMEAVKVGDVVDVTVLSVDAAKKRIALSMIGGAAE